MGSPPAVEPERQPNVKPSAPGPTVAVTQKPRRVYRGTGVFWALIAALVAGVLLIVLIAQNTGSVTVYFLWFAAEVSLVVLVLATVLLAVCLAEGIGLVWRHRRRQRLTQRDELRRIHESKI